MVRSFVTGFNIVLRSNPLNILFLVCPNTCNYGFSYEHMLPLFHGNNRQKKYDSVLVLGNVVGGHLPGDARDSRVVSICLIVRQIVGTLGCMLSCPLRL